MGVIEDLSSLLGRGGAGKAQDGRGKSLSARIRENERLAERRVEGQRSARRRAATVQDALGFEEIYEDGVAKVEDGLYAATVAFSDVNYVATTEQERSRIWRLLCELWNNFQAEWTAQLTLVNRVADASGRYEQVKLPYTGNGDEDHLVDDYNAMLRSCIAKAGTREIVRERYITMSTPCPDHEAASVSLSGMLTPTVATLERMGCKAHALDGNEYLTLVASMTRPDERVRCDLAEIESLGITQKDVVAPLSLDFTPDGTSGRNDSWRAGATLAKMPDGSLSDEMWFQALTFREPYPAIVTDRAFTDLLALPVPMVITMMVHPYEQSKAIQLLSKKVSFMKSEQAHEGRKAAREGLDPAMAQSLSLTQSLSEGEDFLDALVDRDEKLFSTCMQVTLWDRDRGRLEDSAFKVAQEASKRVFTLGVPRYQLRDCMNTALPFACDYMRWHRHLLTTEVATFQPFVTMEINDRGGTYVGQNTLSGNMILLARRRLTAPMGWVLGMPGSGKSFAVKQEIFQNFIANPTDNFYVIDPAGEYTHLVRELGGEVIDIAADSDSHLNLFDLNTSYSPSGGDPYVSKSQFVITTICALLGESELSAKMKSIIDKTVLTSYAWCRKAGQTTPTLTTFYYLLRERGQQDPDYKALADELERYVEGSLRTFSYPSNVDTRARLVCFNLKRLTGDLKLFGQLVTLDAIWNRTTMNQDRGVRTWCYIDEAHNFFKSEPALEWFTKFWSEGRKYLLIPTGITQNLDRVLEHEEAKHMFSNSDFVMALRQSENDAERLVKIFRLSEEQRNALLEAEPGQGLLIAARAVLPFRNQMPSDTRLYKLIDTDPNAVEAQAAMRRAALLREGEDGRRKA